MCIQVCLTNSVNGQAIHVQSVQQNLIATFRMLGHVASHTSGLSQYNHNKPWQRLIYSYVSVEQKFSIPKCRARSGTSAKKMVLTSCTGSSAYGVKPIGQ